jgi:hypothetical protein
MKKSLYALFALAVIAGSSSCTKTNKRKFSSDWNVTYDKEHFFTGDASNSWDQSLVLEDETASLTSRFTDNGQLTADVVSGTVSVNTFTIKKDGTWSREKAYELNHESGKSIHTASSSGTWTFLGKSRSDDEDFRRRDRVLFSVLRSTEHSDWYSPGAGDYTTMSDEDVTLDPGVQTTIYVITESKRNELKLEQEGTNTQPVLMGGSQGLVPVYSHNELVMKSK